MSFRVLRNLLKQKLVKSTDFYTLTAPITFHLTELISSREFRLNLNLITETVYLLTHDDSQFRESLF